MLLMYIMNCYFVSRLHRPLKKGGRPHTTHHWSVPKRRLAGCHTVYNWRKNNCCLFW